MQDSFTPLSTMSISGEQEGVISTLPLGDIGRRGREKAQSCSVSFT
jgi:hypothetical protein